ncbi:MAG: isoprenylcysteine carboxylmethyltransferase family protein [Acidobacteria bacterium]|nr:isoprenylcysteine carboxylmethyltransferase family protein [Acidobacteriota bacterium]
MELIRVYLLAGLVLHKVVWEVLRQGLDKRGRLPGFRPIKAVKMAALAFLLLQPFLPELLPIAARPAVVHAAGLLLFTTGLVVAITARLQLGRNWSDLEAAAVQPGQALVRTGLYRDIRHPIYLGDLLLVAGFELALNSWLVLLALPLAAFIWRKAAQEEAILAAGFAGYGEYVANSGRFLPRCAAVGIAAAAAVFCLQLAQVHINHEGNWTGLFLTSAWEKQLIPPELKSEHIRIQPGSMGYDGQYYHFMAHDPLPDGTMQAFIDAPGLRYTRILAPGLAYLLALGRSEWVDPAFFALNLLFFFLGAWWLAQLAVRAGCSRYLGLTFLLIPAALISIERVTVDLPLIALCCGFAVYALENRLGMLFGVVLAATLARETGGLLVGSAGLWLLLQRRWLPAFAFGAAAIPFFAWRQYVQENVPRFYSDHVSISTSGFAFFVRFLHPIPYGFPAPISAAATALDYISLAGVALAIVLAAVVLFRRPQDPVVLGALPFATLPLVLGGIVGWYEPFGYPRTLSPLFLFLGIIALRTGWRLPLLPLALILPRILMQLAPQLPLVRLMMGGS